MKALDTLFRWYVGEFGETESMLLEKQFWKRGNGNDYALLSPTESLLPFQFFLPLSSAIAEDSRIVSWHIVEVGNPSNRISLYDKRSLISTFQNQQGIWYIHKGDPLGISLSGRTWYSVIVLLSGRHIVSERFRSACSMADLEKQVEMVWFNDCDMAGIVYQTGFRNLFYSEYPLDALEPVTYEEGTENGIKQFVPTLQIQYDQWRMQGLFPDYVYEALVSARTHKTLTVYTGGNYIDMRLKDATADWEGDLALVTLKLEDQERKVISACCGDLAEEQLFAAAANNDSFIVGANPGQTTYQSVRSVLDNDIGKNLTVFSTSNVTAGCTVTMSPDGVFSVDVPSQWATDGGICTFSYTATDAFGATITANVQFEVSTTL